MRQIARLAFSQTARYFLLGESDKAVIPSDPSTPDKNWRSNHTDLFQLTLNVLLSLSFKVLDDYIVSTHINNGVLVQGQNSDVWFDTRQKPKPILTKKINLLEISFDLPVLRGLVTILLL